MSISCHRFLPALLAVCFLLPAPLAGQRSAAQAPTIQAVEALIQAEQLDAAWAALQGMDPTEPVLRLRVTVAVRQARPDLALSAYERLTEILQREEPPVVREVARGFLDLLRRHDDPMVRIASCRALIDADARDCATDLERVAQDDREPRRVRLRAAAVLAASGNRSGRTLLTQLASGVQGHEQVSVAAAVEGLPPDVAVPLLSNLLGSRLPEVQYMAATLLGDMNTREARVALLAFVARPERSLALGAARFSLARLGDPTQLAAVIESLPLLAEGDLYQAGRALLNAGDPRWLPALERVMGSSHEQLRLDAAVVVAPAAPRSAAPVIEQGLYSADPLLRTRALEAVATLAWPLSPHLRRMLKDPSPAVRAAAAAALLKAPPPPASQPD